VGLGGGGGCIECANGTTMEEKRMPEAWSERHRPRGLVDPRKPLDPGPYPCTASA